METSYIKHQVQFGENQTILDRTDNDGDYCKKNCRWVTCSESNLNTRRSKSKRICQRCIEFEKYQGSGWRTIAKQTGIPGSTIIYHIYGHKNYHK